MKYARRILILLVVPLAIFAIWLAYGSGEFARQAGAKEPGGNEVQAHLEQAANSIIAAATQSIANAESDEQAINRTHLSMEALRVIGLLGGRDAESQTEKLLDDLQGSAKPAVAEAIIQMRLGRQLRQWNQLDAAARGQAIDRFVADVKQNGLTRAHADLLMKLSDMLERSEQGELASKAIGELLPIFDASSDPQVQRRAPLLEGVVRRMPGNQLELEGKLLDGSEFDWESLRGKVVLVDFFASWCGPCRAEVPNILANYRAYGDKGFTVVGVNMDKDRDAAEGYVQQAGFDFPVLFGDDPDATGWDHPMGRKYGVTALPRVILVDEEGVIVHTEARGPKLASLLQEMLGAPVGSSRGDTTSTDAPAAEQGLDAESDVAPAAFEEDAAPEVE